VEDGTCAVLAALPLIRLSLKHTRILDKGLENLSASNTLRVIHLGRCHKISDEGIKPLAERLPLQALYLSRCYQLTDTSLEYLAAASSLRKLCLYRCTKISIEARALLKAQFPPWQLQIFGEER
jgi:Leucine Rich repeat